MKIIKQIWNIAGDLRLGFILALSSAFFFLVGSYNSYVNYNLFNSMNEKRLQDWITENLASHMSDSWWLPPLLLSLALLASNTLACSTNRILSLFRMRGKTPAKNLLFNSIPSIIHILFLIVMAGHLVTFTTGSIYRVNIDEKSSIKIPGNGAVLTVKSIVNEFFPMDSKLAGRISQTTVVLVDGSGTEIPVSYMRHASYGGYILHLDMVREKKPESFGNENDGSGKKPVKNRRGDLLFQSEYTGIKPKNQIVFIEDPGIELIFPAFTAILLLMLAFYINTLAEKNNGILNPGPRQNSRS
ncbi:MAG: hypothetical protein MUD12_05985 [Spirochaetes bacterium]|jgi:hypothetical protein|nr:hypothetical protein [Spirochaetota bacterium]